MMTEQEYLDLKIEIETTKPMKTNWADTQFLYCYECVYPTYTTKVGENNGVWECEECGTTNDINKGDNQ